MSLNFVGLLRSVEKRRNAFMALWLATNAAIASSPADHRYHRECCNVQDLSHNTCKPWILINFSMLESIRKFWQRNWKTDYSKYEKNSGSRKGSIHIYGLFFLFSVISVEVIIHFTFSWYGLNYLESHQIFLVCLSISYTSLSWFNLWWFTVFKHNPYLWYHCLLEKAGTWK